MKKIFILMSLLFLTSCGSKELINDNCNYQKEQQISAEKDVICDASMNWIDEYYTENTEIVKVSQKGKYKVISNNVVLDNDKQISCTLDIDIRDNKFKVTYKNIIFSNGKQIGQILLKKLEPQLNTAIFHLCEKIKAG